MAKLSRSWSFFSGSRGQNRDYLNQDYQPSTPSSRVNLQERFSGPGRGRSGPPPPRPPPPPPQSLGSVPNPHLKGPCTSVAQEDAQGPEDHYSYPDYENIDHQHPHPRLTRDTAGNGWKRSPCPSHPMDAHYPRRPLRRLPSGVAPLWNNIQGNVKQLKPQTSKIFQESGKKMNRALQGVRTSLSSLSQIFRSSTRRRYKLDSGTPTRTPRRTPRRTPGKLYSPFNLSTPPTPYSHKGAKRLQNTAPRRNIYGNENPGLVRTPQHHSQLPPFSSTSHSLQRDTAAVGQGLRELEHITSGILDNGKAKWTQFR